MYNQSVQDRIKDFARFFELDEETAAQYYRYVKFVEDNVRLENRKVC